MMLKLAAAACLAAAALASAAVLRPAPRRAPPPAGHIADADDIATVSAGAPIYRRNCSGCHGRYLQGQALWQLPDSEGRRAPAQDATGHSWQHPDEDLFHIIKYGKFITAPPGRASFMPAFAGALSDRDILNVLSFIKARWPLGLRVSQALLNPGHAGMPKNADQVDWKFPPQCPALGASSPLP